MVVRERNKKALLRKLKIFRPKKILATLRETEEVQRKGLVEDVDCKADRRRVPERLITEAPSLGRTKNQESDIASPRTNAIRIVKRTPEAVHLAKIGCNRVRWQRQLNQPLCDCRFSIVIISCHPSFFITKIRLR